MQALGSNYFKTFLAKSNFIKMKYTVKVTGYVLIKYVDGQIHLQLILYYQSIGKGQAKIFFFRYSPIKVQILFSHWNGIHNCKYQKPIILEAFF